MARSRDEQMLFEFKILVAIWVVCGMAIAASFVVGCTQRRELVDPYRYDFNCPIKWCQPEGGRHAKQERDPSQECPSTQAHDAGASDAP